MLIDALRSYRRALGLPSVRPRPRRRRGEPTRFVAAAQRLEDRTLLSGVQFFTKFESVDWTSVGAGGIGGYAAGGTAALPLDGVQGEIIAGYLYWQGIDRTAEGGDGVYDNESVVFAGTNVAGTSIGTGGTGFWGTGGSQAFRADVTELLRTGNQDYIVTGLAGKPGHQANGVSLIVVYQDGDRTNDRDLYLADGNHVSTHTDDGSWRVHLSDFLYRGKDVRVQFHVADGQAFADPLLRFSTRLGANFPLVLQDQVGLFDGTSVRDEGRSRADNGGLWDIQTLDVSGLFDNPFTGPGLHNVSLVQGAYPGSYDSLSLVALLYDTTAARLDNNVPVALGQAVTTPESRQYQGVLQATDADGDRLSYEIVSSTTNGSLYSWGTGGFAYSPNAGFNGTDSFTFRVFDGTDWSDIATVTITVTANDPPVIADRPFATNEDTPLAGQVTASDPDGDPLNYSVVAGSGPANGTVQFNADGTFLYTPDADFFGTDSFRVRVSDGAAAAFATVSLTVHAVNDSPVAVADSYTVAEDTTLRVAAVQSARLSMTSDPGDWVGQGRTYAYSQFANFKVRTLSLGGKRAVEVYYQNPLNTSDYWSLSFAAPDGEILQVGHYAGAMRYPFNDGSEPGLSVSGQHRGCNTLTGEFTIRRLIYAADGSIAEFEADFLQHCEGLTPALRGTVAYTAAGDGPSVLNNDSDIDGDTLAAVLVDGPQHGTLSLAEDGSFYYTPDQNWHGTDSFTYRAFDGVAYSEPKTVTITVTPVNDAPVAAVDLAFGGDEDRAITGRLTASDVDGDALSYFVDDWPQHGRLVINADGSFTYTPHSNFHGADAFGFRVRDAQNASDTATVEVVVEPVNDPPVASPGEFTVREGRALSGSVTGSDVEGASLTYRIVTSVGHGTLTLNPDGTFSYAPDAGFSGSDSFTFVASDGEADSSPSTVNITVLFDEPPVVTGPTSFLVPERSPIGTPVGTLEASDAESDPLSFAIVGGTGEGVFAVDAASGRITVLDPARLRYGLNPSFTLLVGVSDGLKVTPVTVTINLERVVLPVRIDVKPGDSADGIRLGKDSTVEVAILGAIDLDVRSIDLQTLTFGVTGDEDSLNRHRKHGWLKYEFRDVDGDGREDLVVTFDVDKTGLSEGEIELTLKGRLTDGTEFAGTDTVIATANGGNRKNRR